MHTAHLVVDVLGWVIVIALIIAFLRLMKRLGVSDRRITLYVTLITAGGPILLIGQTVDDLTFGR